MDCALLPPPHAVVLDHRALRLVACLVLCRRRWRQQMRKPGRAGGKCLGFSSAMHSGVPTLRPLTRVACCGRRTPARSASNGDLGPIERAKAALEAETLDRASLVRRMHMHKHWPTWLQF